MSFKSGVRRAVKQAAKNISRAASQSQSDRAKSGRKPSSRTRQLQRDATALAKLQKALRRF